MKLIILIFLIGCSQSESNAVSWINKEYPARPVHSVSCEANEDSRGLVSCTVYIESGRLFRHKLKCYNRDVKFPLERKCSEEFGE